MLKKQFYILCFFFFILMIPFIHKMNQSIKIDLNPDIKITIKRVDDGYCGFQNNKKIRNTYAKINNSYYFFDKKGVMSSSQWKVINDKKYYFGKNGKAYTGIKKVGPFTLGFSKTGHLLENSGYKKIDGKHYYFTEKGVASKGLYKVGSNYCYFNGDGTIAKSTLKTIHNEIYYFDQKGKMVTGFRKVQKDYYYFTKEGKAIRSKWITSNGKRYYAGNDGRFYRNGLKRLGIHVYYFNKNGRLHTGYKSITADDEINYYYFNAKGISLSGIYYNRFFNGDGTLAKGEFKEYQGKTYFFLRNSRICKSEWRNIRADSDLNEVKYISTDLTTGEVKHGYTKIHRDGKEYIFYLDKDARYGYRTGKQDCGELGSFYFDVEHGNEGYLRSGIITDSNTKKMYYCNPQTYQIVSNDVLHIQGTNAYFNINAQGEVQYKTEIKDDDDLLTKFIKICFSEMFKDYGHLSIGKLKKMNLDEINDYSCSGYVLRMLYEVFKPRDLLGTNHDVGYSIYLEREKGTRISEIYSPKLGVQNLKPGDFIFINKEDCYDSFNDLGNPVMIDLDEDGICDREHAQFIGNNGHLISLHVHHVGIYIGNGLYINSLPRKGVVISELPVDGEIQYTSAYGRIRFEDIKN